MVDKRCKYEGNECEGRYNHCNDEMLNIGGLLRKSWECCTRRWTIQDKLKEKNDKK